MATYLKETWLSDLKKDENKLSRIVKKFKNENTFLIFQTTKKSNGEITSTEPIK